MTRTHHRRRAVPVVAALCLAAACSTTGHAAGGTRTTAHAASSTTAPAASSTTSTTSASTTTSAPPVPTTAPPGAAQVQVLDAGAAPRSLLRLTPALGAQQAITLHQEQEQRITAGGQTSDESSPSTEFDVRYVVTSASADRYSADARYEAGRVLGTTGADPAITDGLRTVVRAFAGAVAHGVYDHRGDVIRVQPPDIKLPGDLASLGTTMLKGISSQATQLAVPLPEEPVGNGAHWQARSQVSVGGLTMDLVTDLDGVKISGSHVDATVHQTLTFVAGDTTISGEHAHVDGGTLSGSGTVHWDLHAITPLIDQTIEGTSSITVDGPNGPVQVRQFQHQSVRITAR